MSGLFSDSFRGNSAFAGPQWQILKKRQIEAEAGVDATQVIPIPQQGRPDEFQGAVGKYEIATTTDSTITHAGDPITLQIAIRGNGPLELVQAPPLGILDEDFRVDQQPLAGFVQDGAKYFTTTVRPRDTSVTAIPRIKMSFFDPETETFETVQSKPIAIEVRESETLQINSIVSGTPTDEQTTPSETKPVPISSGFSPRRMLFANRSGVTVLGNQSVGSLVPAAIALMLLPPFCFLVVWSVANRSRFRPPSRWFRTHRGQAIKDLQGVSSGEQIPAVLIAYLTAIRDEAVTPSDSDWLAGLGFLRARGQSELAAELETIAHQSKAVNEPGETLAARATDWIERTDAARKSRWRTSTHAQVQRSHEKRIRSKIAGQAILVITLSLTSQLAFASDPLPLNESQCSLLLTEANTIYTDALNDHSGQAKPQFARAAEKYQRLVDSGIENGELYLNLGHAYYQSDQLGRAISNYRHAEKYRPFCPTAQLTTVLAQVRTGAPLDQLRLPLLWFAVLGSASVVGWGLLVVQIFYRNRRFRRISVVLLLIAAASAAMFARETDFVSPRQAIAVVNELTLRDGDDDSFATTATLTGVEGRSFTVLGARSGWVNILSDQSQGWVPGSDVELVSQ